MKKILAVVITLVLVFVLSGCAYSKEESYTQEEVDSLTQTAIREAIQDFREETNGVRDVIDTRLETLEEYYPLNESISIEKEGAILVVALIHGEIVAYELCKVDCISEGLALDNWNDFYYTYQRDTLIIELETYFETLEVE